MEKKVAVLIDAENISSKYYETIIKEVGSYGEILTKRAYADWTTQYMKKWRCVLEKEPATCYQQFRIGKNGTDTRIIIEVALMVRDIPNIDVFCIGSSDADFCGLAQWLRENGKFVIGMGEKKSPQCWQKACNKFILLKESDPSLLPKRDQCGKASNLRLIA